MVVKNYQGIDLLVHMQASVEPVQSVRIHQDTRFCPTLKDIQKAVERSDEIKRKLQDEA